MLVLLGGRGLHLQRGHRDPLLHLEARLGLSGRRGLGFGGNGDGVGIVGVGLRLVVNDIVAVVIAVPMST